MCTRDGSRPSYFVNARLAASSGEVDRLARAEAAATSARIAAEARAVKAVVSETEDAFRDGRYGTCFNCDGPVVIPGLNHVLCPDCGWVPRPVVKEDVELPGHHD